MSIDFNKQLVFDPKIDIVGEEVPLAALEKTGNVLQGRYDKSYEQYSMADEALKQMEASANPVDREKAKELRGLYTQEMQGIVDKGDFHNMRQQTAALARNAAVNYKTIADRNVKIQSDLEALAKDPRYRLDPEGAKKEYLSKVAAVNINPETRTISDFTVNPYNAAADVSIAEKALKIAPTIRTVTRGGENARLVQQLFDGKPVWTKVSTSGKTEFLSADEIDKELSAYLKTDPEIQAYIVRDTGRLGYDVNTKEGKEVYDKLLNERISSSTKALGPMYAVDINLQGNDIDAIGGGAALGDKKPTTMGVPVNTVADSYGPTNNSLRQTLIQGLEGEKGNINNILYFLNKNINDKNLLPTQKLEYSRLKKAIKSIESLTDDEKKELANEFQLNAGDILESLDDKPDSTFSPKVDAVFKELNKYIGATMSLDSEAENKFNAHAKANLAFQNINLLVPHYQDAESINQMQTWMAKSLAGNDFKSFKGKIDPKADYSLSKISDRPVGNGTGIVIELKNNADNSTILVEPKDERMLYALEKNFPGISSANRFKNTSDFNTGEIRSIKDIYKENNPGTKDANLFPKNYPDKLKQGKISYNDGVFMLLDVNNKVIKDESGQPIVSTSYLDLIQ